MTHDELMAKVDELERFSEWTHYLGDNRYAQSIPHTQKVLLAALRAVVELHKPDILQRICSCCSGSYIQDYCCSRAIIYPCLTIQAIEKELK